VRALVPQLLAGRIAIPESSARNLGRLTEAINQWSDEDCASLVLHLSTLGDEHLIYDAHPKARKIAHIWSSAVLTPNHIEGLENFRTAAERGPTVVICNHLSYADSVIIDSMLSWHGGDDLAVRTFSAAGPKVYSDLFRRFATGCISTLPVPQSASLKGTGQLSPRELARKAIISFKAAQTALEHGRVLLMFAEGSRSRSGRLGPFLQGVTRYLRVEGCQVVPAAIVGTHEVMGVGPDELHPGPVTLRFGAPLNVADHHNKTIMSVIHERIVDLLPEHMRPE
jgi:1-acyl-sn-glycerol-3-phosphate acyltransferase